MTLLNKNWSLNVNNFSLIDKLKISYFILNPKNRWTQDKQVQAFEKKFAQFVGSKYAVFVSSGSTANSLIAQYYKSTQKDTKKNIVVLPSTTWQTSCAPWIQAGFESYFIDISMTDFSLDKFKLEDYVKNNHEKIACIFPTSLIGYVPDMEFYLELKKKYKVNIAFDNCENTLGNFNNNNVSSFFTSSTSTYFGHQIQSIEGGFIFTNSEQEYHYFLMNRNHGMTRSLSVYGIDNKQYVNKDVDGLFDFYSLGTNFRNTDLNAFIGQLDFNRSNFYSYKRKHLYSKFKLDPIKFYLPEPNRKDGISDVPFCLPVIIKNSNKQLFDKALEICKQNGIEYRPIISGYLGYQTCYKKYFKSEKKYPNSVYIHNYGFYIGLHSGVTDKQIIDLVNKLNNL
jgi:CDP-6-deoxy-D-xylo-4-hexulose-3-dehydrase